MVAALLQNARLASQGADQLGAGDDSLLGVPSDRAAA